MVEIKIMQHNVRSLMKNMNELYATILHYGIEIIALQETWLNSKNFFPSLSGYVIAEKRRKSQGGGVAILYKQNLKVTPLKFNNEITLSKIELVGIRLKLAKSHVDILSVYVPPNSSKEDFNYLNTIDWDNTIAMGDFNALTKRWSPGNPNERGKWLLNMVSDNYLTICGNQNTSTLIHKTARSSPDLLLIGQKIMISKLIWKTLDNGQICF